MEINILTGTVVRCGCDTTPSPSADIFNSVHLIYFVGLLLVVGIIYFSRRYANNPKAQTLGPVAEPIDANKIPRFDPFAHTTNVKILEMLGRSIDDPTNIQKGIAYLPKTYFEYFSFGHYWHSQSILNQINYTPEYADGYKFELYAARLKELRELYYSTRPIANSYQPISTPNYQFQIMGREETYAKATGVFLAGYNDIQILTFHIYDSNLLPESSLIKRVRMSRGKLKKIQFKFDEEEVTIAAPKNTLVVAVYQITVEDKPALAIVYQLPDPVINKIGELITEYRTKGLKVKTSNIWHELTPSTFTFWAKNGWSLGLNISDGILSKIEYEPRSSVIRNYSTSASPVQARLNKSKKLLASIKEELEKIYRYDKHHQNWFGEPKLSDLYLYHEDPAVLPKALDGVNFTTVDGHDEYLWITTVTLDRDLFSDEKIVEATNLYWKPLNTHAVYPTVKISDFTKLDNAKARQIGEESILNWWNSEEHAGQEDSESQAEREHRLAQAQRLLKLLDAGEVYMARPELAEEFDLSGAGPFFAIDRPEDKEIILFFIGED